MRSKFDFKMFNDKEFSLSFSYRFEIDTIVSIRS